MVKSFRIQLGGEMMSRALEPGCNVAWYSKCSGLSRVAWVFLGHLIRGTLNNTVSFVKTMVGNESQLTLLEPKDHLKMSKIVQV